jgi:hypothetical protein
MIIGSLKNAHFILNGRNFISSENYFSFDYMRVYPKVSRLATWNKNCKWYSSLPLGAVVFTIL